MKKVIVTLCILAGLFSVGMVALIASITWDQYQDTKVWQNTGWNIPLSEVPSTFVKNYTAPGDLPAITIWKDVTGACDALEQEAPTPETIVSYQALLQQAYTTQESYPLIGEEFVEQTDTLALYLELEDALQTAYETPDKERMDAAYAQLTAWQIVHPNANITRYVEAFQTVKNQYEQLSLFLQDVFPQLGTKAGNHLVGNPDLDLETTNTWLDGINASGLRVFPLVDALYQKMDGHDWTLLLRHNDQARSYQAWQENKAVLESYSKSDYVPVSAIQTYQDALDYGFPVEVFERPNTIINPSSPVYAITYRGESLYANQYIRKGTSVLVKIEPIYEELVTEPETTEELPLVTEPPSTEEPIPTMEETSSENLGEWNEEW